MDERNNLPSASGIQRLALCSGSFALEQTQPPEPESQEASSGTRIHAALAKFYATNRDPETDSLTDAEAETFNMCATVADRLVFAWINPEMPSTAHKLEQREWLHVGLDEVMSGQYDVLLIQGRRALVIDYKTGHGDQAESVENLQLRALAAIVAEAEAVDEVTVAIIQPWVSMTPQTCVYDKSALWLARVDILRILEAAKAADAPLVPGDKQCRFCRAKAVCPALNGQVVRFAGLALSTITDDDLPRLLEICGAVEKAVGVIRARAKEVLRTRPEVLPEWGLGKERTRRYISDPLLAFSKLSSALTPEQFAGTCDPSVPELETLYARIVAEKTGLTQRECKQQFAHLMEGVILSKTSEPQLVRAKPALKEAA